MTLREFKAKYLTKLLNLRKQLIEKYPEKKERIEYIISILVAKLEHLRTFTLSDYLSSIYHATREFKELEELIPSEDEIKKLLERDE